MDEQTGISSNLSGGEKPRRMKRWFFFFFFLLLLGGLDQAAGQSDHIRDIAMVTDCTQIVHQGLTQTERAVDPIVSDSPTDRCELADCNEAYPDLYAKGKPGRAANPTESEFAKLSPKVLMAQSTPYTSLAKTSDSQRKWMEETLCADSYEEEVTERKDTFGQSFYSDVYKVKNLMKLGESVCKVTVQGVGHGTGFVLFGNFILTNAHLFNDHVDEETMQVDVNVWVDFYYDDPQSLTNVYYFTCKKTLIVFDENRDYAILELNPEGHNYNNQYTKAKLPPGLLKNFGPMPQSGQAFIIGHPGGGVKKMDPTYIIEKKDRVQAINDHLRPYKDNLFTAYSIIQKITDQGIEHILPDGALADNVVTYKTFMLHGSSGSPAFDSFGRVFGLHSGMYGQTSGDNIIMGCARPVLTIYKQFVTKLNASGNYKLLSRVEKEARGNIWLELIAPLTKYHDDHKFSDDYSSKEEL